jgi:cbb3-type cytochrome c oxidase subunit III
VQVKIRTMAELNTSKTRALFWALPLCLAALAAGPAMAASEFANVIAKKPDAQHGQELFTACAACHGADGGGVAAGSVPRIAGQYYRVLVRQLVDFRRGRRWDAQMEDVATSHEIIPEQQDIADVAFYVSRLARNGERGIRDGEYADRGAAIYAANCRSCHGAAGEGNEKKGVPRLAGQHAGYLARQIYDAVDGRRPMLAGSHGKRFEKFDFQDVLGLSDYLARLGWEIPAR